MEDVQFDLRAYRFCLDPTNTQRDEFFRFSNASRWAFNYALAAKKKALDTRSLQIDELVTLGYSEKEAAREAVKVPGSFDVKSHYWMRFRHVVSPWWNGITVRVFESGFANADAAWKNWIESVTGKRKGARVGFPTFKRKGRCRDSFRLAHDVKKPGIRAEGYRRLRIPGIGEVRVHGTMKKMVRTIRAGAVVQSVTVSRGGDRWYASVLVKSVAVPALPTRRQRAAGTVGVDLGVKCLAALSTGEVIENPRHTRRSARAVARAQRALSRTERNSKGRRKARARLARVQHATMQRRASSLHHVTKRLASGWARVAVEDLNVKGMTSSARGTVDNPGRKVRQKAGLNKAILDAAPGEFRRQLGYKTRWHGSELAVCDRWFPSSKTCSVCGAVKTKLSLSERVFSCGCGAVLDRDVNAARNIAAVAVLVTF